MSVTSETSIGTGSTKYWKQPKTTENNQTLTKNYQNFGSQLLTTRKFEIAI